MTIKLIIGLQNPGSLYQSTRHNVGGWFVRTLTQRQGAKFQVEKKCHAELSSFKLDNQVCRTMLPLTYMNQSGLPTREASQFYRIQAEEILIVHDDLDLAAGRIKLKTDGGNGGHNGLRNITTHLGSSAYHRLRIGIGHPGIKEQVLDYVLGKPSHEDLPLILDAIDRGIDIIPMLLSGDIMNAMNILNK